jgi:hypothetical protein
MPNQFRPQKFHDHEIVDESLTVIGHIRVKPSGVLWAPKGSHNWHRVSLEDFAAFMEKNGSKQKK